MAKIFAELKGMDRAEWLRKRLHGIGGSEAGAACGVDRFMSELELWERKTGRWDSEKDRDTERIRLGRDLEPYIAKRFSEVTGKELRVPESMYVHDEIDFAIADLDREIVGENACLECRTVSSAFERLPDSFEELPEYLLAQCYHYLAVMSFEKIYLALLDLFTGELKIYEIPYDHQKCSGLLNAEQRFWRNCVILDIPPKPDGSDSAEEALKMLPEPVRGTQTDLGYYSENVDELFGIRKKIKELEAREKLLRQELIAVMGEASSAVTPKYRLELSRQTRKLVDSKLLKENHAEIYRECLKDSSANILKIIEI